MLVDSMTNSGGMDVIIVAISFSFAVSFTNFGPNYFSEYVGSNFCFIDSPNSLSCSFTAHKCGGNTVVEAWRSYRSMCHFVVLIDMCIWFYCILYRCSGPRYYEGFDYRCFTWFISYYRAVSFFLLCHKYITSVWYWSKYWVWVPNICVGQSEDHMSGTRTQYFN